MFDIWFYYKGNDVIRAKSINQVSYFSDGTEVMVSGEDILTHPFPCTKELFLVSETRTYCMSSKGLIGICVKTRND